MHAMDPQQRPSEREREIRAGISTFFVTALCGGLAIGSTASAAAPDQTGREILPVPPQPFTGVMKPALDQSTPVGFQLVRSEEHTSELQSLLRISYSVFYLKKNKQPNNQVYLSSPLLSS